MKIVLPFCGVRDADVPFFLWYHEGGRRARRFPKKDRQPAVSFGLGKI